mmetsp:Transcript_60473/g.67644  ORF Transcript_60473/g.67644 Transcript_60473/m.67644 type:complete len:478 (-) Transcript_60473:52-1485(-)
MTSKKRDRRRRRARCTVANDTAKKEASVLKTETTEGGSVRTISTAGATLHASSSTLSSSSSSSLSTDDFVAAGVVVLVVSLVLGNVLILRLPFIDYGKYIIRSPAVRVIIVFLMSILLLVLLFIVVVRIGECNKISRALSSEIRETTTKIKEEKYEIPTVQPLRLRPFVMETTGDNDTEYNNNNNNNDEHNHDHTPVLAKPNRVRKKLAEWLPFGLRYTSDINLVYSTNIHGRSLSMLYNQLEKTSSRHTILLLEVLLPQQVSSSLSSTPLTLRSLVVGMYASQLWHCSSKLYGDGQCFLFRLIEELDDNNHNKENGCNRNKCADNNKNNECICWKWKPPPSSFAATTSSYNNNTTPITNSSDFNNTINNTTALWETFQRSNKNSLSMGMSDCGLGAGLKLNYDLTIGESYCAVGFNNDPLVKKIEVGIITNNNNNVNNNSENGRDEEVDVSGGVMFDIGLVEVYQLVREIDGIPIQ